MKMGKIKDAILGFYTLVPLGHALYGTSNTYYKLVFLY